MSKIVRKTAQLFGTGAGFDQVAQFGSLAASAPNYSIDPAVIQSLAAWVSGWFDAVLGGNSPAIEDMNGFCLVMAYQAAYILQQGIGEWDLGTTYYTNSLCTVGGVIYVSLQDTNLNNSPTSSSAYWGNYLALQGVGDYSSSTTYPANALCASGGILYVSIAGSNTGNTPSSSPSFWANYVTQTAVANSIAVARTRSTGSSTEGVGGIAISSSCGTFSNSTTNYVAVTNLSVTLTTSGRPIFVGLISDSTSNNDAYFGCTNPSAASGSGAELKFFNGATGVGSYRVGTQASATGTFFTEAFVPASAANIVDFQAAGTYTYTVQINNNANSIAYLEYAKLIAYEL